MTPRYRRRWLAGWCLLLFFAGCGPAGPTVEKETGYRGPAARDAFLAFQRFAQRYDWMVEKGAWPREVVKDQVVVVPMSQISTELQIREMRGWLNDGAHVMLWGANADERSDDWGYARRSTEVPEKLREWLREQLKLEVLDGEKAVLKPSMSSWSLEGRDYEMDTYSSVVMRHEGKEIPGFRRWKIGQGLLSVVSDARPFRNRYIDQPDHPEFIATLLRLEDFEGSGWLYLVRGEPVGFLRILWERAWPALVGLGLVVAVWLWKNLPRSGPTKVLALDEGGRGYDLHLEALGDFYWRLDRGVGLLQPMRDRLFERSLAMIQLTGRADLEPVGWLSQRSGLPEERVMAALASENPPDPLRMVRVVADLQKLQQCVL